MPKSYSKQGRSNEMHSFDNWRWWTCPMNNWTCPTWSEDSRNFKQLFLKVQLRISRFVKYSNFGSVVSKIKDLAIKSIVKNKNLPFILTTKTKRKCKNWNLFAEVTTEDIDI